MNILHNYFDKNNIWKSRNIIFKLFSCIHIRSYIFSREKTEIGFRHNFVSLLKWFKFNFCWELKLRLYAKFRYALFRRVPTLINYNIFGDDFCGSEQISQTFSCVKVEHELYELRNVRDSTKWISSYQLCSLLMRYIRLLCACLT